MEEDVLIGVKEGGQFTRYGYNNNVYGGSSYETL